MTTELTDFVDLADETTATWTALIRTKHVDPQEAKIGLIAATDEDFENRGATLVAMASAAHDLDHVTISVHAFRDGSRVEPDVMILGDEIIITIKNA
jgi:hypothetical protein